MGFFVFGFKKLYSKVLHGKIFLSYVKKLSVFLQSGNCTGFFNFSKPYQLALSRKALEVFILNLKFFVYLS